eukprot:8164437-Pyramimonas_sp.AAC.1
MGRSTLFCEPSPGDGGPRGDAGAGGPGGCTTSRRASAEAGCVSASSFGANRVSFGGLPSWLASSLMGGSLGPLLPRPRPLPLPRRRLLFVTDEASSEG